MSKKTIVLTGITTTGTPHLGNYVGAIRPAIEASRNPDVSSFYFLADFHALIKCDEPARVYRSRQEIAATWLAMGLDPQVATFYRQSDIPEITELTWILTCLTAKGLMNRAHAYKASVDANQAAGNPDLDDGITMGLFSYPVLMAADILMFNANQVPVGKDQVQHIEMARDIAGRFNHTYAPLFTLPEAVVGEEGAVLSGLDGRKMSKSYNNTIPLFVEPDELRKLIYQIKTDSRMPGEPKDTEGSSLFEIYSAFADRQQRDAMAARFAAGDGWGELKEQLFEFLDAQLTAPRAEYKRLMADQGYLEQILRHGAEKARAYATPLMDEVRRAVGLNSFTAGLVQDDRQQGKKADKELTADEQAKLDAGKARAQEIARQREAEARQQAEAELQQLLEARSGDLAALAAELLDQHETASKKDKKALRLKLDIVEEWQQA
ncbi:tryptophan--tRNA ligase [Pokkaliibacter plantistimulans]|uniref:Tryptophan--tRNA ligase n=1 Tax=Proteobacteria bacterium 228 TaxID=2083153 RepID=A0A2S5KME1_9PROT|nr:tryptophan--tRNA ligase [Pokkaliibacter plantistimulans]PPC75486.1 tryptophan--tRNA ligase [Pokkaliibacter plantistimulans]